MIAEKRRITGCLILLFILSFRVVRANATIGKFNPDVVIHTTDADITIGEEIVWDHVAIESHRILFNTTYFGIYPSAGTVAVTLNSIDTDDMISNFTADGTDTTYNWTWAAPTTPFLVELSGALTSVYIIAYEPVVRTLSFTLNGSGSVDVKINSTIHGTPSSVTYSNGTNISFDYNAGTQIANFSVSLSEEEIIVDWPAGEFVDLDAPDDDHVIVWGVGGTLLLSFDNETGSIALDDGGNNNDGTINGATRTGCGLYGRALIFDGINDYVNISDSASLNISSSISILAWIKTSDSSGTQGILVKTGSYGLSVIPNFGIRMTINATNVDTPPYAFNSGEWTYIAGVFDGRDIAIYINGVLSSVKEVLGSIALTNNDVFIGNLTTNFFNGTIDEVRITNQMYDDWWDIDWRYRTKITFNNTLSAENLANFPVLVHLDDTNIDWNDVLANGEDIRFVDSDDITELSYEIEEWDDTNDAWIWVNVPQIDAGSVVDYIWMYFDNYNATDGQDVTGTWNNNFTMVQHLPDNSTSTTLDSTQYDNDGIKKGANEPIETSSGQINSAQKFDGTDDYISVVDGPDSDPMTSVGAWVYVPSEMAHGTGQHILVSDEAGWRNGLYIVYTTSPNAFLYVGYNGTRTISTSGEDIPAYDAWYYVVGTFNATDGHTRLYVDGVLVQTSSGDMEGTIVDNAEPLRMGGGVLNRYSNVTLDEVRTSNITWSVDWIEAQYLSMTDIFATYGSPVPKTTSPLSPSLSLLMYNPIATFPYNLQASITGMDCTDWVFVGDGYHFVGEYVRQNASYPLTDVGLMFSDGVGWTIATFDLVDEDWDLISDGAYTMVNTNSSECNTFTITWELYISSGMFDAINVDLWLYCLDSATESDGYEITEEDYFNIYNTGGSEEYESSGDGFSILGEGVFGLAATNSSNPEGSWAYANITWRKLQHMGFLVHMWQNTTWDTGGHWNCPTEHAETASVEYGIDYWYNGSWMTGWSVVLEVIDGEAGTFGGGADQAWVLINATWYNGDVVIDWDTFYTYYEAIQSGDTTTQFALRVDLWVGIEGGSSTVAGRVRPEYFGMNESGWGPWATWGPVSGLEDESVFYDDLLDGDGNPISAGELELFLAWANLTKTSPDAGDPDCDTHLWALIDYDGPHWRTLFVTDQMVGINTPLIPDAITPGDVSMGFFANLITAMIEGITKPIVAALGGGATAMYFFTAGIIDSAFEYFNIFNFMASITTMITTYGSYFATSMANMILLTVQMFRIITSVSGFLIEWLTRMITFLIELFTIVVNILNGTQAGVGAIYDVWALFEVSEWIDFIPVAIFIAWIQAIDDRSAKMGGGTLTIIIGDLQMASWVIGFMVDWFSRIINFVINNVMAIMNAIRIRMSI